MKNMLKTVCFLLVLTTVNCGSTQGGESKKTSDTKTEIKEVSATEMKEKGFSKGTLTANKSEGCPFILNIEEYQDKLDPINLTDFYKSTEVPTQVWVKFSSLRMPSRCNEARPVSITEINTRKE